MYCVGWKGFTGRIWPASRCVESPDIDRRVVTAHTTACVQHQRWTVVTSVRRHGHNFLSRNRVTWRPARGTSQHRTPTTPTELFTSNPAIYFPYFPEVNKRCLYFFGMLPGFFENCWRVEICSVVLWQQRKPHWVSSSFGSFNYFHGIMACTLCGRLSKKIPR